MVEIESNDSELVEIHLDEVIDIMREIRQKEEVGVKARRIAIAITMVEQAHAYWLSYVIDGESRST